MPQKSWLHIYIPIAVNFILFRVISQTDIIMASHFGDEALAAYGMAIKLMIIDMTVAIAFAPVLSIVVARGSSDGNEIDQVRRVLGLSCIVAISLAVLCFWPYQAGVQLYAVSSSIHDLTSGAVFWLTVTIPFRFLIFCTNMVLHGKGKGGWVVWCAVIEVLLNLSLNWLFAFHWELGFSGLYFSTFVVAIVSMLLHGLLLGRVLNSWKLARLPGFEFSKELLSKVGQELARIGSHKFLAFFALYLVAFYDQNIEALSTFSVAYECLILASMSTIAMMRTTAIHCAKTAEAQSARSMLGSYSSHIQTAWALVFVLGLVLYVWGDVFGSAIYHLNVAGNSWWRSFYLALPFILGFEVLDALTKGIFHAKQQFKLVRNVDMVAQWCLFLPLFWLGAHTNEPWLVWSAFILPPALSFASLLALEKRAT